MTDQNQTQNRLHSVTTAALCTGALALVGIFFQECSRSKTERDQFESALILRALETGDSEQTRNFLKFFIETGFISDKNDKIANVLKDTTFHIKLPVANNNEPVEAGVQRPRAVRSNYREFAGIVVDADTEKPLSGVIFKIYEGHQLFDSLVTESSGQYSLALPSSTYAQIVVEKPGYQYYNRITLTSQKRPFRFRLKRAE